jgi:hypothetical protein
VNNDLAAGDPSWPPESSTADESMEAGTEQESDGADTADQLSGGIGICVSGGGIRSAAFGLGALQVLQRQGILKRANYLAAVSGGSYIVGALALVEKGEIASARGHYPKFRTPGPDMPAFSRNSPEERYLRNNLRYLTHGPGGGVGVAGRVLFGLLLNLLFFATFLWLSMLPLGWAYGALWRELQDSAPCGQPPSAGCIIHFHPHPLTWWTVALTAVAAGLFGLVWAGVAWRTPAKRKAFGATAGVLLGLMAMILVLAVGVPYVLAFLRGTVARYPTVPTMVAINQGAAARRSSNTLLVGAGLGLIGSILSILGWLSALAQKVTPNEKAVASWLARFMQRHRTFFINAVAAVAGPLLTLTLALLAVNFGASHLPGSRNGQLSHILFFVAPFAGLLCIYHLADLNSWSLHPYFRQHLSQAFALGRVEVTSSPTEQVPRERSTTTVATSSGLIQDAMQRPYECPYLLSESLPSGGGFPAVLICAAANINDYGKMPTGRNAASFVFSAKTIGGPTVGECDTGVYERTTWAQPVTVPGVLAIAGAGISPEMTRLTRWPLRFLMTLANVRFGVWLPNPDIVANQREDLSDKIRKWLWTRIIRKDPEALAYRRPRPRYLFRELFGRNRRDSHFIYVTDGGQYENLGLVELIRRRCSVIYCIDGSGDKQDAFETIGRAFSLARAEEQAEIHLDPRQQMGPADDGPHVYGRPDLPFATSMFAEGTISYRDGMGTAKLIIVKAGVTKDAPWDIRSWQESHPEFPCDPGFNQFFTADQFDAYRALGEFGMIQALATRGDGHSPGRGAGETGQETALRAASTTIRSA